MSKDQFSDSGNTEICPQCSWLFSKPTKKSPRCGQKRTIKKVVKDKTPISSKRASKNKIAGKNAIEYVQNMPKECPRCKLVQEGNAKVCIKCGWVFISL